MKFIVTLVSLSIAVLAVNGVPSELPERTQRGTIRIGGVVGAIAQFQRQIDTDRKGYVEFGFSDDKAAVGKHAEYNEATTKEIVQELRDQCSQMGKDTAMRCDPLSASWKSEHETLSNFPEAGMGFCTADGQAILGLSQIQFRGRAVHVFNGCRISKEYEDLNTVDELATLPSGLVILEHHRTDKKEPESLSDTGREVYGPFYASADISFRNHWNSYAVYRED